MRWLTTTIVSIVVCRQKAKVDCAFITHIIEPAYEDIGKLGVIVPHGVLFRGSSEGKIGEQLIRENLQEAVIGLPANLLRYRYSGCNTHFQQG